VFFIDNNWFCFTDWSVLGIHLAGAACCVDEGEIACTERVRLKHCIGVIGHKY